MVVEALQKKKRLLEKQVESLNESIKIIQETCTHKDENGKSTMEYVGHNSHNEYFECSICKKFITK